MCDKKFCCRYRVVSAFFLDFDKQVINILHTIRLQIEQHSVQLNTILEILNTSGAVNMPNDEILEGPFKKGG